MFWWFQDIGWDSRILNETNINTFSTADFVKKKDNAEKETGGFNILCIYLIIKNMYKCQVLHFTCT